MLKIIKILFILILSLVLIFFGMVMFLFSIKLKDIRSQINHMEYLRDFYDSESFIPIDETEFVSFDMMDPNIKFQDVQILASHNSYKKQGSSLGHFFVGLGSSKAEAEALEYENIGLTEQLNHGIRSFEFDVRKRKTEFMLTHVPLVDNSSTIPNLRLALEEIYLFSSNHPNHFPITVLIEIKDDWMILDHALQVIEEQELEELNQLIFEEMKDSLYKHSDIILQNTSLSETIMNNGWPSISELLGKVMFILHPGNFTNSFVNLDPTLNDLSIFPGSYPSETIPSYASFYIINDPFSTMIPTYVEQNFIVRTRINESLEFSSDIYQQALSSGAQILTSDFTIARKGLETDAYLYFESYRTIQIKEE